MKFTILTRSKQFPKTGKDVAYLRIDHWNDYSFVTMFEVLIFDNHGEKFELGSVKIGFVGQTSDDSTHSTLDEVFEKLPDGYFSLGQDVNYYRTLASSVSENTREAFLRGLNDLVFDNINYVMASGQDVFRVSLLRSVGIATIEGQFRRVLGGGVPLSNFDFEFRRPQSASVAGIDLRFIVTANSKPSTNIHAVIGRNGVGKTALLNQMIAAITRPDLTESRFYAKERFQEFEIDPTYFSSLVSVAFSAFDPFNPPQEQSDPERGTCYYYIGLKDISDETGTLLKSLSTLRKDCVSSIVECFSDRGKRERWRNAILTLESDGNFAQMNLESLTEYSGRDLTKRAEYLVGRMSSGHSIVLLTISRLVAKVEERTLVLMDEPESHLHPPLLSAFTRALSELLHSRNGVAIIATHSPVVLQEVPRSCASIITRSRLSMHAEAPRIETFGENVGVLTREVFGLEVSRSGFHSLLETAASEGKSYEAIVEEYGGQIGLEARGILRAMVAERDAGGRQA